MLVKMGVDVSKLEFFTRRALDVIDRFWRSEEMGEPVIVSTFNGDHSPGSLHYANKAFDIGKPSVPAAALPKFINRLRIAIGDKFDIVQEPKCIHIEYEPRHRR